MSIARLLCEVDCPLGESPVWNPEDGSLTWVDIAGPALFRLAAGDDSPRRYPTDAAVSAIALAEGGGLIAATSHGFATITIDHHGLRLKLLADRGPVLTEGTRMNDGACDRQGRFWAGEMFAFPNDSRREGRLFRLDHDGGVALGPDRYLVQNGIAFSPDGTRMYVSDSHKTRSAVWQYDYDAATGTMANRALFIAGAAMPGRPDGAAIDTDGCYWSASNDAGVLVRITPDGRIDAQVEVPVPAVSNMCFGGPDLRTMYITTLKRDGTGGQLFAAETGWQGYPEPLFRRSMT